MLDNAAIAELLIREAETASEHRRLAFKRAARAAFSGRKQPILRQKKGRSPNSKESVHGLPDGCTICLSRPPAALYPPPIRCEFLTLAQARRTLANNPDWNYLLKGDLQMHTVWSDGSGTISAMAEAAIKREYQYIAITDHTKGLKIAGGLDEDA